MSIMETLKIFDHNTKGFVVVIDIEDLVLAVITDGNIRTSFINGRDIDDTISSIMKKFTSLRVDALLTDAIEVFKSSAIKFISILVSENRIVNLITKQQMHSLLHFYIHADLPYDFGILDENIVEHEIFQKP